MTIPTLDAALSAYSLTRADLPGIEEAWATQFADLDLPLPESPEAVLVRLNPELDGTRDISIDEVTPRSDGSLTVEVAGYLVDEDEEEEYTTQTIHLTAEGALEFLVARESTERRRTLNTLRISADRTQTGTQPIWWLLTGDTSVVRRYENASRAWGSAQRRVTYVEEYLAQLDTLQNSLDTRTPLDRTVQDRYPYAIGYARGLRPYGVDRAAAREEDVVRADTVSRVAGDLAEREPRFAMMQEAMDAAIALPEGALREFLLGERESRTYSTAVGTGRSKKTVKRTYTPTSDLVSEHKKAVEQHTESTKMRDTLAKRLAHFRKDATGKLWAARAELAQAEAALAAVWAEGWPGDSDAPAPVARDEDSLLSW